MGKVVRIFIILLFILSIAALVMEVQLFGQREQLKGRTQKLENGLVRISEQLTAPRDPHIEAIPQRVDINTLKQYEQMDGPIRLVQTLVDNRTEELFGTREDLEQTRDTLERTRNELAQTRRDLEQARDRIARLQEDIQRKDRQIADLEQTVRDRDDTIAQRDSTIEELRDQVADHREKIEDLEHDIARLERLIPEDEMIGAAPRIPAGLSGNVILVDPEWNFVILNIGTEAGLLPNVELLVHRDEEFISRIRVIAVRERIAVADIQRDSTISSLAEGDSVFFPGG